MLKFPVIENEKDFDEHFQDEIWLDAAKEICRREHISFSEIKRVASSDHVVFAIDDRFVLKIYRPARNCFERETKALEFLSGKIDLTIPEIAQTGAAENLNYVLITQLSGISMTRADWLRLPAQEQVSLAAKLASNLKQIHAIRADSFNCDWAPFVNERAATFVERQIAHGVNEKIIRALPAFIEANLKLVPTGAPTVFLHGDVHFGNLRLQKANGAWKVSGLFDFADSRVGFYEYDFLAVGVLMFQGQTEVQGEFFKSYGYAESELDESFRRRLMMLTMLYETSDLRRYALRLKPEAAGFTLEELERAIWSFAN